ncbi:cupin domain-containing protein [Gulosibacter molinativorax]|nr:cupin domain-containing protein [Gulosibacter molinativorax]QUY62668.1 Hypotetical protein [Gulosibacter molinativorax]
MSEETWRTVVDPVKKQTFTFIETAEETGGARLVTLIEVLPGGGPPEHSHSFAETFELVDGDARVLRDDVWLLLEHGKPITVEGGRFHTFTNASARPATIKVTVHDPGRFEQTMRVLAGLARDGVLAEGKRPPAALLAALVGMGGDYYEPVMPRPLWKLMNAALAPFGRKALRDALARYDRPVLAT